MENYRVLDTRVGMTTAGSPFSWKIIRNLFPHGQEKWDGVCRVTEYLGVFGGVGLYDGDVGE